MTLSFFVLKAYFGDLTMMTIKILLKEILFFQVIGLFEQPGQVNSYLFCQSFDVHTRGSVEYA
jgi:hypothetical protein